MGGSWSAESAAIGGMSWDICNPGILLAWLQQLHQRPCKQDLLPDSGIVTQTRNTHLLFCVQAAVSMGQKSVHEQQDGLPLSKAPSAT